MITKNSLQTRPPRPGTAVTALVKRYRESLTLYIATKTSDSRAHALKMACDKIVMEGERND